MINKITKRLGIIIAGIGMGTLVLAYYAGYERGRREAVILTPLQTQTISPAPSTPTPNLPTTQPAPTATPEIDTSDWKIYKNEDYGFEVKYPKDWVMTSVGTVPFFYEFFPPARESGEISYFRIIVACPTFKEQGFDNLKDYLQFNLTRDSGDKTLKVENVIINGLPGYKTTEYGLAQYDVIYLLKDRLCYRLAIDLFLPELDVQTSRKIRSTFRLVETDETASWNTYRNEEFGFEVKYPPNWSYYPGPLPNTFYFGEDGPYEYQVGISVTPVTSEHNLDSFYRENSASSICIKFFLQNKEGWRCAGEGKLEWERGVKVDYVVNYIKIQVENKENLYSFSVAAHKSKAPERFRLFNQMLSSFRFME